MTSLLMEAESDPEPNTTTFNAMNILPPSPPYPRRLVIYHQTHYHSQNFQSALPLLTRQTGVTHLILAALHINPPKTKEDSLTLTLNDHDPDDPHVAAVWEEAMILQSAGVKVMIMLGGAAAGSYKALDYRPTSKEKNDELFMEYYTPVRELIRTRRLDGIDLNVEEMMSQSGIERLVLQLRKDFPRPFVISFAPMAPGLQGGRDLSYIEYERFEKTHGHHIDFWNVQHYNNWGDAGDSENYTKMIERGFAEDKVLLGLLTHESLGSGALEVEKIIAVIKQIKAKHPGFGGCAAWEWFSAGGGGTPWVWVKAVREALDSVELMEVDEIKKMQ